MFPASFRWKFPLVVFLVGLAAYFAFPVQERINLGLDLQGGMHLVLKVDTSGLPEDAKDEDVTAIALEILRNRIDEFGVSEPVIQRQGTEHILIQLPGVTDRERALNLIGKTAQLKFMLVSENRGALQRATDGNLPEGNILLNGNDGAPYLLETKDVLLGDILADAYVDVGQIGLPVVSFRLTKEGSKEFGRLTGASINRRLAIVLDDTVISAPTIRARITDSGIIEGQFTREEANDLSITLRAGALPAPVVVEEERTVGPTLGKDSIDAGVKAIALGGVIVVVFMLGFYRLAGLIAVIALALNVLMVLGGLGYFGATLTLPGIAGIILTIGMAVDANVLIFERMREELAAKRPVSLAIDAGYAKAFSAIIDSNITTLIAAFFLYWFGTGPIRGFATTLGIGILASLFTSLVVTRMLFEILLATGRLKKLGMMKLLSDTKIDFVSKRFVCWGLSLIAVAIGLTSYVMKGEARYGIDFTGGVLQEYRFNEPIEADVMRDSLNKIGVEGATIQSFGSPTEWLVRTPDVSDEETQITMAKTKQAIEGTFGEAELVRVERVGPTVGPILRQKASFAILWSLGAILLFVAFRFRHFDFGLAALVALAHDVIIGAGALCLAGKEIDFVVVAALMTIAGYSVNDTIVVYDRIRENDRANRKMKFMDVINMSVNQTLSRTLLTSLTTLMVVISLFVVGGEVLHTFAFTLMVGFVVGTYSSIYIASGFVVIWRQLFKGTARS